MARTGPIPIAVFVVFLLQLVIAAPGDSLARRGARAEYRELAGDLPGVLGPGPEPYLVVSDVYVPTGKTVIVQAGTIVLFRNFTTLQVQGTLLAKGEKQRPIIFSSENDRELNSKSTLDPAPYDWNGITIHPDGMGTHLSYCAVQYSVYGINSLTRFVRLDPCLFRNNGRANLTIEGTEQPVGSEPYEYILSTHDPVLAGVPLNLLRDPNALARNLLRYTGLSLCVGSGVVGVWYNTRFAESDSRFERLSSNDIDNLRQSSSTEWKSAQQARHADFAGTLAGYVLSAVGAAAFAWSFTF